MTAVEMKVFNTVSLGRRILHKKIWGKIPALPLAVLLVVASFVAAAVTLGPATSQAIVLGKMTSQGLPTSDVLFGQVGSPGQKIWFNITVASNSYAATHPTFVVLFVSASGTNFPNLAACTAELLVENSDNVTTFSTITPTYSAGCSYSGTLTQNVLAGRITTGAPTWPFRVTYLSSPAGRGPTYTWTSTFWGT